MSLEPAGQSIWRAEGPNVSFFGFPYPTRSVVIRLEDGSLWVWSPIELTPALEREVNELGRVAHLVSPNKIHHLFLQDWHRAYPEASLWGPRTTLAKRTDLSFAGALDSRSPAAWRSEIDQFWFRGSLFMDEIVFFHRRSSTAVIADLSENFSDEFLREHWGWKRAIAKLWKIHVGRGYAPLEWRLSWVHRQPARDALAGLMACEPRHVIMAHGECQADGGLDYLKRAFGWLM